MISVILDGEMHAWAKTHGIVFSQLLRDAINRQREVVEGFIVENVQEERRKKEKAINLRDIAISLMTEEQKNKFAELTMELDVKNGK